MEDAEPETQEVEGVAPKFYRLGSLFSDANSC